MTTFKDEWRTVVVDEDDFRLACHLVQHWHGTSDGSVPELIDRIAAAVTHTRKTSFDAGRREGAQDERDRQRIRGDLCRWCHRQPQLDEVHGTYVHRSPDPDSDPEVACLDAEGHELPHGYSDAEVPF